MNKSLDFKKFTLLYVYGSGRCGSTLLDMLLSGHSKIIGLGEITTLMTIFNPFSLPKEYRFPDPKEKDQYEKFWNQTRYCYEQRSGKLFEQIDLRYPKWGALIRSWDSEDARRWAQPIAVLLSCIYQTSGKPILSVPNKFHHVLHLLLESRLFDIKVIHLMRDGRAVANSYIRRYSDFAGGVRVWAGSAILAPWFRKQVGRGNWLQVKYEELATQPEKTLETICRFLKLDFEPAMLDYRSRTYFGIGGSPTTFSNPNSEISLDERWRKELSWRHRLAFALIAGWLNKFYGYGIL